MSIERVDKIVDAIEQLHAGAHVRWSIAPEYANVPPPMQSTVKVTIMGPVDEVAELFIKVLDGVKDA